MTPKEKSIYILEKMNNGKISKALWDNCSDYARRDLKRKAMIVIAEIIKQFDGLDKPEYCAFDAIGKRKFIFDSEHSTHMTGYDMVAYWEAVKFQVDKW